MGAINLNRVFSEGFFRIPDYQRGYSWNDKQLSELWDDIDEIQEERGELKNITQEPSSSKKQKPMMLKNGSAMISSMWWTGNKD